MTILSKCAGRGAYTRQRALGDASKSSQSDNLLRFGGFIFSNGGAASDEWTSYLSLFLEKKLPRLDRQSTSSINRFALDYSGDRGGSPGEEHRNECLFAQ